MSLRVPRRARALASMTLAGVAAASTACGGGAPTPAVAHLGTTTTTSAAGGGGPSGGASLAQASKYASCMRARGVAAFPDPTPEAGGGFGFAIAGGPNSGVNRASPSFQAADRACRKDLPNQGVQEPLTAAQQQAFLNWAACVRAHGFPAFPDPSFYGGAIRIRFPGAPSVGGPNGPKGAGLSPALQAAMHSCQSKLPSGLGKVGS